MTTSREATVKITITLAADQVTAIRELVAGGRTSSVSGFVQHAVGTALSDAAGWQAMLDNALRQTGGPLTQAERDWADGILEPQQLPPSEAKQPVDRKSSHRNKTA